MSSNLPTHDPTVKNYAHALSKVVIVDQPTELELYRKYKQNGDIGARNKLIESGLRFVVKIAQKYSRDLEHQKSLISAGNEGLLEAVDRFDPTRGTRFLSYATWWVVLFIREELHRSSVVSVPIWRKKSARQVQKVQARLKDKLGRDATDQEIKDETGFSVNQIKWVMQDQHSVIPIDSERDIPSDVNLETSIVNGQGDLILRTVLGHMPVREKFILQAYFGFITDPPMSLKQIASVLGISSERVRQIKIEALETLKRILTEQGIGDLSDLYSP